MAGPVTVSRVYPTYGFLDLPNSGKPEFECHLRLRIQGKRRCPAPGMTKKITLTPPHARDRREGLRPSPAGSGD